MKKTFIRLFSAFLAVVTAISACLCLSSCQLTDEINSAIESVAKEIEAMKYTRGTSDGLVYSSAFLGIQVTLPSSEWHFFTDEEIATNQGNTKAVLSDTEFEDSVGATQFEFMASTSSGLDNMNVTVVKGSSGMELEPVIKEVAAGIETVYSSIGYTPVIGTASEKTVDGIEFWTIQITTDISGVNLEQYIYMSLAGNYCYTITFTSATGITAADYEKTISAIK